MSGTLVIECPNPQCKKNINIQYNSAYYKDKPEVASGGNKINHTYTVDVLECSSCHKTWHLFYSAEEYMEEVKWVTTDLDNEAVKMSQDFIFL